MSLFVDTSIWYAAAESSDRSNACAKAILKSGETLVTSDHVLIDTWTLLHHKVDGRAAESILGRPAKWDRCNGGSNFGGLGGCLGGFPSRVPGLQFPVAASTAPTDTLDEL